MENHDLHEAGQPPEGEILDIGGLIDRREAPRKQELREFTTLENFFRACIEAGVRLVRVTHMMPQEPKKVLQVTAPGAQKPQQPPIMLFSAIQFRDDDIVSPPSRGADDVAAILMTVVHPKTLEDLIDTQHLRDKVMATTDLIIQDGGPFQPGMYNPAIQRAYQQDPQAPARMLKGAVHYYLDGVEQEPPAQGGDGNPLPPKRQQEGIDLKEFGDSS